MKVLEGKLVATKGKFAIVGARFNEFIVSKLISGAEDTLVRHGVDTEKTRSRLYRERVFHLSRE